MILAPATSRQVTHCATSSICLAQRATARAHQKQAVATTPVSPSVAASGPSGSRCALDHPPHHLHRRPPPAHQRLPNQPPDRVLLCGHRAQPAQLQPWQRATRLALLSLQRHTPATPSPGIDWPAPCTRASQPCSVSSRCNGQHTSCETHTQGAPCIDTHTGTHAPAPWQSEM